MPPGDSTQQATTIASQAQGIIGQIISLGSAINTIGFANVLISGAMVWFFCLMMGWAENPFVSAKQFNVHQKAQDEQRQASQEMIKQLREIKCDGKSTLKDAKDCYKEEGLGWK